MSWFTDLFINEAKHALRRHSGTGGSGSEDDTQMYILVDEDGTEIPAVLVDEETVFNATPNDIREGMVAATDAGVTVGTKEIPAYITTEGSTLIPAGRPIRITLNDGKHNYTKMLAVICALNTDVSNSVAVEKSCINDNVYLVNSIESVSVVEKDNEAGAIDFGITNENTRPIVVRYFTYKEE